jgi:prepilin-type N-terminal cleavage/methylation domain-containing protein
VKYGANVARAGLTLIECVAVLALLGVLAATLGRGVLKTQPQGQLKEAVHAVRDAEARARLLALREGRAKLHLVRGGARDFEAQVLGSEGEVVVSRPLPSGIEVRFLVAGEAKDAIGYHARGAFEPFVVEFQAAPSHQLPSQRWSVCQALGTWSEWAR